MQSTIHDILATYRAKSQTEREKGSYFEELIRTYFRFEASYADLYSDVWHFADWANAHGFSAKDTGIDLVAKTRGTEEFHAIQCKCYAENYRVRKADIDSFFTASGQKPFTQRIIVTTTNDWSENAKNSLHSQTPPVYKIDLLDLENSQIDWAKYQPTAAAPVLKKKKELRPHQTSTKGKVTTGLESADRGKLIMACGTGKTFAEDIAGTDKRVAAIRSKYQHLRTVVLVKSDDLLEVAVFEFDTVLYDPGAYSWSWNAKFNLVGKSKESGEHHFTWQPHGSQFTIVETLPVNRLALRLKQPPPLDPTAVLATMNFDESWVQII